MLVHLNSRILPLSDARISPLDRGFIFGDALYEGLRAFDGRIVGAPLHARRLAEGLKEIRLDWDASRLEAMSLELLAANGLKDAFIYWQVSRGAPGPGQPVRARLLKTDVRPTVFGYCSPTPTLTECRGTIPTKSAMTVTDTRWKKCHVKTTSLLGAIMASFDADAAGVDDAIFVADGRVSEGTSANLFAAVQRDDSVEIVTPALDSAPMLAGVTRDVVLAAARRAGLPISERPLPADELARAREVMLCGTLTMITAITKLDGRVLGDGRPGETARRLHGLLIDAIASGA
ncbi:MAG: aminotransferase class IV [Phycisphaerales bacterium]|nr:aminotransferase class IV [Phycisphaerales bacterium]